MQRQVSIEGGPYLFRITGSTLTFDGFLKVYHVEDEDDKNGDPEEGDLKDEDAANEDSVDTEPLGSETEKNAPPSVARSTTRVSLAKPW